MRVLRAVLCLIAVWVVLPGGAAAQVPRTPLPAPTVVLTPAELARWRVVPAFPGTIPVLAYHGIDDTVTPTGPWSVTRTTFARHMAMLSLGGFQPVTIGQFARFAAGDTSGLPPKPILITFDDGRLDSYTGADRILQRYGMRAVMFVITGHADARRAGFLTWDELGRMARSGRWQLQVHAHQGHERIPTGLARSGPFYANLRWHNGVRELFTNYKRRVTADLLAARRRVAANAPGFRPDAFAVPYSDYGQYHTNYAPIPGWLTGWLRTAFRVIFTQDHHWLNVPGRFVNFRYGIHSSTSADELHAWLSSGLTERGLLPPP